jgi:hypothetical protein
MPGFFALAAETLTLRVARRRRLPAPEATNSLRPSAGGANEEAEPRARAVVSRPGTASLLDRRSFGRETRSSLPADGFSARKREPPRAFRGFAFEARQWAKLDRRTPSSRGTLRPFDLHIPSAPLPREERSMTSSRSPTCFSARRRVLAGPCGLSSGASPRCHEFRFYNRTLRVTSTRRNILFGDRPPSAVGNPPAFDFQIPLGLGRCRRFSRGRRRTTLRSSSLQRPRA